MKPDNYRRPLGAWLEAGHDVTLVFVESFPPVTAVMVEDPPVIAEHGAFVWALDDCGEPYTLRADCVERINP